MDYADLLLLRTVKKHYKIHNKNTIWRLHEKFSLLLWRVFTKNTIWY